MGLRRPLPIDPSWESTEQYVESLLTFASTSELFRNLCGGVHILDFLTRKPDLYTWVLPQEWREWFEQVEIEDLLDLLMREDLAQFESNNDSDCRWRKYARPPQNLLGYIKTIRLHSLDRSFPPKQDLASLPRHIAVGMKPKKIHEVEQFAAFVDDLSQRLSTPAKGAQPAPTGDAAYRLRPAIVDFGSGQNYLGRTLACPPYNKTVIAIEQRHHNVEGARGMDVSARLAKKQKRIINKKEYKRQLELQRGLTKAEEKLLPYESSVNNTHASADGPAEAVELAAIAYSDVPDEPRYSGYITNGTSNPQSGQDDQMFLNTARVQQPKHDEIERQSHDLNANSGGMHYIEKELHNGDLSDILQPLTDSSVATEPNTPAPIQIVVSIHSCGNLTHHGLRSLTLNPSVQAVALIGCCYNLLTERLGPPTYKLPSLRSNHPRLEETSSAFDPHGFPMSKRLENFEYAVKLSSKLQDGDTDGCEKGSDENGGRKGEATFERGLRLNITTRMMAVQAPSNWTPKDSEEFFTRHYYRAVLQRILLDLGVVKMSQSSSTSEIQSAGGTLSNKTSNSSPLVIGSLRKACFANFETYVRGAVEKLSKDPDDGAMIAEKTRVLVGDGGGSIREYEERYGYAKKQLSVIWSLMAFSAGVVESVILVDRWLWLREQEGVGEAWIESVFEYGLSPRNMVVVGVKKRNPLQ